MLAVVPDSVETARPTTFETMYRTHYKAVEHYVGGHFPGVDRAEVMSHVFETAWRRFEHVPAESTRGWLIGVARNSALNGARSARRRDQHTADFASMQSRWSHDLHQLDVPIETREALAAALESLSESDREVLLLSTWNGLTGPDLGAALGVSAGTAGVRLFRARQRLREAFGTAGGER